MSRAWKVFSELEKASIENTCGEKIWGKETPVKYPKPKASFKLRGQRFRGRLSWWFSG